VFEGLVWLACGEKRSEEEEEEEAWVLWDETVTFNHKFAGSLIESSWK